MDRFFVVTGGPGSGKTSLLEMLATRGLACGAEAGRAIIREQVARGGAALPWADREAFAARMLAFDLDTYRSAEARPEPTIFDRGVPDIVGYLRLVGLPVPAALDDAARRCRYNRRVFAAPPWPAIYAQDAERKQTFAEAAATFEAVTAAYRAYGYDIVTLPCVGIAERAGFVRGAIERALANP